MDRQQSQKGKRARRSVNDLLRAYYAFWLQHFENDSEAFLLQVIRLADRRHDNSPSTAPT